MADDRLLASLSLDCLDRKKETKFLKPGADKRISHYSLKIKVLETNWSWWDNSLVCWSVSWEDFSDTVRRIEKWNIFIQVLLLHCQFCCQFCVGNSLVTPDQNKVIRGRIDSMTGISHKRRKHWRRRGHELTIYTKYYVCFLSFP